MFLMSSSLSFITSIFIVQTLRKNLSEITVPLSLQALSVAALQVLAAAPRGSASGVSTTIEVGQELLLVLEGKSIEKVNFLQPQQPQQP